MQRSTGCRVGVDIPFASREPGQMPAAHRDAAVFVLLGSICDFAGCFVIGELLPTDQRL
jgi:hypothetical protein